MQLAVRITYMNMTSTKPRRYRATRGKHFAEVACDNYPSEMCAMKAALLALIRKMEWEHTASMGWAVGRLNADTVVFVCLPSMLDPHDNNHDVVVPATVENKPAKKPIRYFSAEAMSEDDFKVPFTNEPGEVIYDAVTKDGRWATMTIRSWKTHGIGRLGSGYGQKYCRNALGQLLKVEG